MTRFYCPKGISVYQRENGVIINGIYAFVNGERFEFKRRFRNSGAWESDHDAYRHLAPDNLVEWSDKDE